MGGALLLPLLSLLFLSFLKGARPSTFTVKNNCGYTVWPGILSNAGVAPPSTTGFSLSPGESRAVAVADGWSGRMWGRTLCVQSSSSGAGFACATGDCGSGTVECSGRGAAPPATLAEFTLASIGGDDFYDVSLVDGFNVPVLVAPANGSCPTTDCPADLNAQCPPELRVVVAGATVACRSACEAFGAEAYCCSGAHGTPATCAPTAYSRLFKAACPRAYSYAYDDATSTFTCAGGSAGYGVVFCPAGGSSSPPSHEHRAAIARAKRCASVFLPGIVAAVMAEEHRGEALPDNGHGGIDGGEPEAVHGATAGPVGGAVPYPVISVESALDHRHVGPSTSILRSNAPSLNVGVDGDRGEEEQEITCVRLMDSEARNEDMIDKSGLHLIRPEVGMTFESEKEAYNMYNSYAGQVGFSVRKSTTKHRSDGSLSQKFFVCNWQGYRRNENSQKDISRTSCDARVQFSISKENLWRVQKVVLAHNHYLASPNKTHKLRSQREVIEADRQLIGQIRQAGMKPGQVFDFMKEYYGGEDKVPFSKMDCYNEIGRERRQYLEANDAQTLSEYLRNKQLQDPTFFYAIQVDKESCRIANFFWADGQSIMDYKCFGDVVSFDTTFQTNKFEMPFAPILGTNHHKQTIIFGCALIFNETIESFVWLFETFLTAMSRKHPSTIFTDQDAAMAAAIAYVFPNTAHRLCLWHIYLNATKHLGPVIQASKNKAEDTSEEKAEDISEEKAKEKSDNKFWVEFKSCIYEDRAEIYFTQKWHELLAKYNLENNTWMANLYALRAKWAAVYRDSFTADMNSTQRSEGMNNVFKKRFRRKLGLSELLVECENVAISLRSNELDADFQSRRKTPVSYIPSLPMLKTAAEKYTRRMYSEFEEEFKRQLTLSCELVEAVGTKSTFFVKYMESDRGATVVFNTEDFTVTCSCRMFECIGLLCKHALRVYNINKVYDLPLQYILPRWTKYAKSGFYVQKPGTEEADLKTQAALLSREATSLALKCSSSQVLIDKMKKAMHDLNLEADTYLSEMHENTNGIPPVPNECAQQPSHGAISFKIPQVVKGSKKTRQKSAIEKNTQKKKKGGQKKGEVSKQNDVETIIDERVEPHQIIESNVGSSSALDAPLVQGGYANSMMPHFNYFVNPSAMTTSYMPGGYTGLLMGVDQNVAAQSTVRKLHFDGEKNRESM